MLINFAAFLQVKEIDMDKGSSDVHEEMHAMNVNVLGSNEFEYSLSSNEHYDWRDRHGGHSEMAFAAQMSQLRPATVNI